MLNLAEKSLCVQRQAPLAIALEPARSRQVPAAKTLIEPPRCPEHSTDFRAGCRPCQTRIRWYRARSHGKPSQWRMPAAPVQERLLLLRSRGKSTEEVAKVAGVARSTLEACALGLSRTVLSDTAAAVMAVEVPPEPIGLAVVPSVGTQRRLRVMSCEGHTNDIVANRVGWTRSTVSGWLTFDHVRADVAAAVKHMYREVKGKPGPSHAGARKALTRGWLSRRYWPDHLIDDPSYDPHANVRKPLGARRRLRALWSVGHGAAAIGEAIGERPAVVEVWTLDEVPMPAYVIHLIADAYERLSGTIGDDQEATDRALHRQWASPLAWDDVDMDCPTARARRQCEGPGKDTIEPSILFAALSGHEVFSALTPAEREMAVTLLLQRGWDHRKIGAHLRVSDTPEKSGDAITQFVIRMHKRQQAAAEPEPPEPDTSDDVPADMPCAA